MGHRHLINSSLQIFEMNQEHYGSEGTAEQSHIHMGRAVAPANGSMFYPMENTLLGGAYSVSQQDLGSRPVEHSLSNIRSEGPPSQIPVSGPTYDPSQQFHSVGSFYPASLNNTSHGHTSYYNRNSIHNIDNGLAIHSSGNERGPFERKRPRISVASEIGGSTSAFSAAGSSSTSSAYQLEKPTSDYQNYSSSSIGLPHYHSDGFPTSSEGFPRNVRSRSRLDLEHTSSRPYMPNCSSNYYHPTAYLTNHSGPDDIANSNVGTTGLEQNHIPLFAVNGRSSTSENNGISHQMNQFLIEGTTAENNGYRHDPMLSRNPVLPPPHHHRFQPHMATESRINYPQRSMPPYQASSSAPRWRHEALPLGNGPEFISETYTSRYTRPASAGGRRNSHRDGRSRITTERSDSLYDAAADGHDRMRSEAFMMVDRSSFYGSRHLFDQYGDLRLDVDNMTYEELLALGERIGNVNTGLSEGMISNCLVEKTNFSTDNDQEEASCPICLEGYKSKEEVGTIKNCCHDYHVGCIKKWLLMKNACPICKAPALSDSVKKQ